MQRPEIKHKDNLYYSIKCSVFKILSNALTHHNYTEITARKRVLLIVTFTLLIWKSSKGISFQIQLLHSHTHTKSL